MNPTHVATVNADPDTAQTNIRMVADGEHFWSVSESVDEVIEKLSQKE